ncbi:MAG TPA: hypothetical protein VJA94_13380 [Candidatus Angelobacter sp.]
MRPGSRFWYVPIFVIWAAVIAQSQAATPLGAIDELTRAEKLADILKHYPAAVQEVVSELPEGEKAEVSKRLSVASRIREAGYELRRTDDLRFWQFVDKAGSVHATLTLVNYFISGTDSVILFHWDSPPNKKELKFAYLRYERGEWRIINFGDWRSEIDLESDGFISEFTSSGRNEKAATLTLLRVLSALSIYARSHPGSGLPTSLDVLSEPVVEEDAQPDADIEDGTEEEEEAHDDSGAQKPPAAPYLADMVFKDNRAIKDGYEFRYLLIDPLVSDRSAGKYQITATPIEFAKTGRKSYFVDQSSTIHFTLENRPANENDECLDGSSIFYSEMLFEARLGGRRVIR